MPHSHHGELGEGAPDAAVDGFCRKAGVTRSQLDVRDVRWLTNYNLDDPSSVAESKRLRKMGMDFNEQGSPLLKVPNLETPRTAMREGIKRRVSGLLESAQALVTGGSSSR